MKGVGIFIALLLIVTQVWASGWREVENLETDGYSYVEGLNPFARLGSFDSSDSQMGSYTPEILRWGMQRNLGVDYSSGLFSNRSDLGVFNQKRKTENYAPRLMPFGGPLEYSQGRGFTFSLDESVSSFSTDADFLEYYQYAMPFRSSTGELEFSYGQYDSITSMIRTEMPMDNFQLAFDFSLREFGNYEDGSGILMSQSLDLENPKVRYIDQAVDEDIYQIREFQTSGKYVFSPTQTLEFNGKFTDSEGVFFPELRMDAEYDRGANVSAVYHVKNPSASIQKLSIRAFTANAQQELNDRWRQSKITNLEEPELDDFSTRANSRSFTQGFDFLAIKDFSDSQIGFGLRRYWQNWQAESETLGTASEMLPDINQSNLEAYLEGHRYVGNFLISGAVRIDQFDTEVDGDMRFIRQYRSDVIRRIQDSALSTSVRINYDLTDSSLIYLEFEHASRVPDPNEMYIQYQYERAPGNELIWLGNPDLNSVKNTAVDLGFEVDIDRLNFRINGFYSNVLDLIYLENISSSISNDDGSVFLGTAMSYKNEDAILWGGEAALNFQISKAFKITGGIEFVEGKKVRLDGNSGDEDLAELPPLRAKIGLEYNNRLWFGKVEAEMAEARLNVDESISETTLDGYTVVNCLVGYYLTENLLWTVGVENIADQAYSSDNVNIRNPFSNYGVINEPGRFVYMSIKWGF